MSFASSNASAAFIATARRRALPQKVLQAMLMPTPANKPAWLAYQISVGGMSADDALCFEQTSTSLYEESGNAPRKRSVLSLARAEAEYCALGDTDATPPGDERNANDAQPEVVVQLRKHRGKLEVFLDGFLSDGQLEKRNGVDVHVHKLTWHHGLHEDVETDTRVFSPLAIVAAIEDGQRPLQDVSVSVWTSFENQGMPLFNQLLVSETPLVPHRATDARCYTVRAPYPLAYPPAPSMIIFDRFKKRRQIATKVLEAAGEGFKSALKQGFEELRDITKNHGRSEHPIYAAIKNSFGSLLEATGKKTVLGDTTSTAIKQSVVAGVAAAFMNREWFLASAIASATIRWTGLNLGLDPKEPVQNFWLISKIATDAAINYVSARPLGDEGKTKFTLKELVRAIWSLSVIRGRQNQHTGIDELRRTQSEQYRREQVVWEWLRGSGNIKPMNDSLLNVSTMYATRLGVRISVDDAFGCAPGATHHEIVCDRDDAHALGALAAGTARDLLALFDAVKALERNLEKGLNDSGETWWDYAGAVVKTQYDAMKKMLVQMQTIPAGEQTPDSAGSVEGFEKAEQEAAAKAQGDPDADPDENLDVEALATEEETAEKKVEKAKEKYEADKTDPENKTAWQQARRALAKVQTYGLFKQFRRAARRRLAKTIANVSSPEAENRLNVLKAVLQGIQDKLHPMLFDDASNARQLYLRLQNVAKDKRLRVPKPMACTHVRRLPHRGTAANTRRLFLFRADSSNGYVDLSSTYAASRVYSEFHDANQMVAVAMDGSAMALRRLVREWESQSSTRVKLTCMCKAIDEDAFEARQFKERVAFGTLVLTTPVDVQVAGVLSNPTEHVQRQMRLVVRRAQQKGGKSALERLGLESNDASLLAMQVFGDLWSEELVALHRLGRKHAQVQLLEQASRRASARLRAAGRLVLELLTVHNPQSGLVDFDDVPCNATDISLVATRRGRDAGLIVERLLFGQNYIAIRAAFAPLMRQVARAAIKCADAFERSVPEHLPHEPTASLFGDPFDGVAAYVRVRRVASQDAVVSAAAAAYPAVLLLGGDPASHAAAIDAAERRPAPKAERKPLLGFAQLVGAMRHRLASLKMDALPLDDDDEDDTVDALADKLAVADLNAPHSYYVPFGFGDARPPPTLPPLSAPMFGSVPVYGPSLVNAFVALQQRGVTTARSLRVVLRPTLGCLQPLSTSEAASDHPNVLQVSVESGGAVAVRYTASRVRGAALPQGAGTYTDNPDVATAAEAHERGETAARLASDVCAIAWNAERVMQAVVAALASASLSGEEHDGIALTLVLPGDDPEHSIWFARPKALGTSKQRDRLHKTRTTLAVMETQYCDTKHQRLARELIAALQRYGVGGKAADADTDTSVVRVIQALGGMDAKLDDPKALRDRSVERQTALESLATHFDDNAAAAAVNTPSSLAFGPATAAVAREGAKSALVREYSALLRGTNEQLARVEGAYNGWFALVADAKTTDNAPVERVYAGLACSLGVGMAMLSPLLGEAVPMHVEVGRAEDANGNPSWQWRGSGAPVADLAVAFGKCEAMRMSEACLVVAGAIANS
jgi:hypothetical protein